MIFISNLQGRRGGILSGGPGCLIFGILAAVAIWFVLKGLYALLYWAAPVLFVLALVIQWRAVADTGKDFLSLFQRNPLAGLLLAGLCVLAFPLLAMYLFLRALGYNKAEELKQQFGQGAWERPGVGEDFVEFEEIESRPKGNPVSRDEPMELPLEPEKEPPLNPPSRS